MYDCRLFFRSFEYFFQTGGCGVGRTVGEEESESASFGIAAASESGAAFDEVSMTAYGAGHLFEFCDARSAGLFFGFRLFVLSFGGFFCFGRCLGDDAAV